MIHFDLQLSSGNASIARCSALSGALAFHGIDQLAGGE